MINGVIIKKLDKNIDERGWLAEIYRNDEIDHHPAMSYVSLTKPGVIRGPHEHKEQTDFFVFLGPGDFELHLWDNREDSRTRGGYMKIEAGENSPVSVLVPPGIIHGYKCVSGVNGLCINFPDKLYKGKNRGEDIDEIRWEGREDSPHRIN